MTQADRILALLRERGAQGATNYELMKISYQYPARIHTLRHKRGFTIRRVHLDGTAWKFYLEEPETRVTAPEPPAKAMHVELEMRK